MKLTAIRYTGDKDSSGGLLFVDDKFFCYLCEDEQREIKVVGETRIPAGTYEIKLRDKGGMTKRYADRYYFHRGMLHLQAVPGFEYIYIHTGNSDDHTDGCLLVGYGTYRLKNETFVSRSRSAYTDLYLVILAEMDMGKKIEIEVKEI